MHSVAVDCIFDGNNRRPPITCCSGRCLNTTDSVNTDHSDGKKTERKRDAYCESALSQPVPPPACLPSCKQKLVNRNKDLL